MNLPAHQLSMTVLMTPDRANVAGNVEVGIKVMTENIRTQEMRHANSCFFTMVAVGDDRKPLAVPPLQPTTPDEQRRHAAADVRRQLRQEYVKRYEALRSAAH